MTIYLREMSTESDIFKNKGIEIHTIGRDLKDSVLQQRIDIPDNVVICNGCNGNIFPENGIAVFLDKEHLDQDVFYDIYHDNQDCLGIFKSGIRIN